MSRRYRQPGTASPIRRRATLRVVLLLSLALAFWSLLGRAPQPQLQMTTSLPGIGPSTEIAATAEESRFGLTSLEVQLEQGEHREVVGMETFDPRPLFWPWGGKTARSTLRVRVGSAHQEWLTDGEATLRVRAKRHAGPLRGDKFVERVEVLPVRITPPQLAILSTQTWVRQGGSETVVYSVESTAVRHGVRAGERWFPGADLTGQPGASFALFSAPWDSDDEDLHLEAEDALGNRVLLPFVDRFEPRPVGSSSINLSDAFLEKVVPPIVAQTRGLAAAATPLETYLEINGRLRADNRAQLVELGAQSADEFLWDKPFLPFPGGKVMDGFAMRRAYRYGGETVDEQVHLGFDLASVARAAVPAANRGRVLLAGYLGIYGNVVVVDHGFGLMTLYAHLSTLEVAEGDVVNRGQSLGRTGATGLAGGDHLHFATLLRGLPVDPVEWWDDHWIRDRIGRKLGSGLPLMAVSP
ncbi:MAG: M23 family metallopeptidase [Thermoanaerobaculia bacterium]|nr:M23 family metallopeptidase [Thermoanaerobaculia bacterium]